jgi:TrmH family RNA methyltransferase
VFKNACIQVSGYRLFESGFAGWSSGALEYKPSGSASTAFIRICAVVSANNRQNTRKMNTQIRFVLCETTHPGNIGAAARAMKTMGFSELVLVRPRHFPDPEADARASGAFDVLTRARVVDELADAVSDCGLVVATSARNRRAHRKELDSRAGAEEIWQAASSAPVAIVFGTESAGLTNAQLDLCQRLVYIPSNPDYSSLNLASAVQLLAYELRYAQAALRPAKQADYPPATSGQMEHFYTHLSDELIASGFLERDNPRQLMRRLRLIFDRAELDEHEVNILRGVLTALATEQSHEQQTDDKKAS